MGKIKTIIFLVIFVLISIFISNYYIEFFKEVVPNKDNTIVWELSYADIDSWDPHRNNSSIVADITRQIFEGLTVLSEDGYKLGVAETFRMSPNAEGVDNTVYTFKLRQDAKWSDGMGVTAYDFEYSFKRACENDSDVSNIYVQYIKGADKYIKDTRNSDDIKVEALDKYTLEIELNKPTPYFLEILAMPQFYPVREDIIQSVGELWETNPKTCISNGPYKLYLYEPNSYILLSKNNSYYNKEDVKTPFVKCLINTQDENNIYDDNEIHVTNMYSYKNLNEKDVLQSDYIGTSFILFNTDKKLFNTTDVRRAFSYGIDSKYYCNNLDFGIQAYGFIPPNMKFNDGSLIQEIRKDTDHLLNVNSKKAEQLLNASGYNSDLVKVELTTDNEFYGSFIKSMLEGNLNIKVSLNIVTFEELIKRKLTGDFDLITSSWRADYNDPMAFLDYFNMSSNVGRWYDKKYEEAVANCRIAKIEDRDKFLIEAERILNSEIPAIPVYHYRNYYFYNDDIIDNLKLDAVGNLVIKHSILKKDHIIATSSMDLVRDEHKNIYGFDNRNRKKEIDEYGYFEDSSGYRFDRYLATEHFEIYYNSINENNEYYALNSIKILEEEYDRILSFFNIKELSMSTIKINMYDEYHALRQSAKSEINVDIEDFKYINVKGITIKSNMFYYTWRYKGSAKELKTVLLHEFTHTVTMALANSMRHPDWLWEGVAMYMAQDEDRYEPYYEELIEKGIPEMYKLKRTDIDQYIYGYSMVEFVDQNYGKNKVVELVTEYGDIEKVLDITENEFRDKWIKFLKEKAQMIN